MQSQFIPGHLTHIILYTTVETKEGLNTLGFMNTHVASVLNSSVSYVYGINLNSCSEPYCHLLSLVGPTLSSIVKGYYQGHPCVPTSALHTCLSPFALGNQICFQRRATAVHLTSSAPFFPTYTPHYTHHKYTHITAPHINNSYT